MGTVRPSYWMKASAVISTNHSSREKKQTTMYEARGRITFQRLLGWDRTLERGKLKRLGLRQRISGRTSRTPRVVPAGGEESMAHEVGNLVRNEIPSRLML